MRPALLRSDPSPRAPHTDQLRGGVRVFVVAGPVRGSGVDWYHVEYGGDVEGWRWGGFGGWVSEDMLVPTVMECPPSGTLSELAALQPRERSYCFADRDVTLAPVMGTEYQVGGPGTWLSVDGNADFLDSIPYRDREAAPPAPLSRWISVTGRFGPDGVLVLDAHAPTAPPAFELQGTWRRLPDAPIEGRMQHVAVWTGEEMIVWGGANPEGALDDGAAFDPATNRWRAIARSPIGGRVGSRAVWTGREVLIWGGSSLSGEQLPADGAAYDPKTDRWRQIPPAPFDVRGGDAAVWTGRELVAARMDWDGDIPPRLSAYEPVEDRWRRLPDPPVRAGWSQSLAWTGDEVGLVVHRNEGRSELAFLDPQTDRWRRTAPAPVHSLDTTTLGWSGAEWLFLTLSKESIDHAPAGTYYVAAYDPVDDRWRIDEPGIRVPYWSVEAGRYVMGWGGSGSAFDSRTGRWLTLPRVEDRSRESWSMVWTGTELIIWGGVEYHSVNVPPADGLAFRPRPTVP